MATPRLPFELKVAVSPAVLLLALLLAVLPIAAARAQSDACEQPLPVCDVRAAVFAISSFDPIGSAVRIGPTRLVTARHVVADEQAVTVFWPMERRLKLGSFQLIIPATSSCWKAPNCRRVRA